jgi:hypothetical protein
MNLQSFHYTGILIGIGAFLIIGLLHPVVIKTEYHFGTKPWPVFLVLGIGCVGLSLLLDNIILSTLTGVLGFSLFWTILELFEQKKRVEKGWFPKKVDKEK